MASTSRSSSLVCGSSSESSASPALLPSPPSSSSSPESSITSCSSSTSTSIPSSSSSSISSIALPLLRRWAAVLEKPRAAEEARLDVDGGFRVEKLRVAENERHARDAAKLRASEVRRDKELDKLLDAYEYNGDRQSHKGSSGRKVNVNVNQRLAQESLYSQVTGVPQRAPEPRQPVRGIPDVPSSRFSGSTTYSSWLHPDPTPAQAHANPDSAPTPAQEYARSVSQLAMLVDQVPQPLQRQQRGAYWLQPAHTGSTGGLRNAFLR
ncbi:hypothetical protein C8Q80DRAFT_292083 [Daedaleopsis nitida]|nr:hypothetical protein C8Q80DRAFT_292083 [Daedaleopsis nitida]